MNRYGEDQRQQGGGPRQDDHEEHERRSAEADDARTRVPGRAARASEDPQNLGPKDIERQRQRAASQPAEGAPAGETANRQGKQGQK